LIVSSRGELLLVVCFLHALLAQLPTNAGKIYPHYDFVLSLSFFHYVYTNTAV
jgi:hypothetical protein